MMETLSAEEFAAQQISRQDVVYDRIRPIVQQALTSKRYMALSVALVFEFRDAYERAGGTGSPATTLFLQQWQSTFSAVKDDSPAGIDRLSRQLATAIVAAAETSASHVTNREGDEDVWLEWVDVGDSKVRDTHHGRQIARIRPGGKFKVGEAEMPYPGYPGAPLEETANCRCSVRVVREQGGAIAAAAVDPAADGGIDDGAPAEVPLDEPTHAGLAVIAADTGRILLIQRSMDPEDPPDVQGTWEFPGGGREGDESPQEAAMREFCEETGLPVPDGEVTNGWRSENGVYQGYVWTTPVEADAFPELNPDLAAAEMINPDDPERRNPDVSAWFTIEQIRNLGPALRPEVADTDWSVFDQAEEEAMTAATDTKPEAEAPPVEAPEEVPTDDGNPDELVHSGPLPWHGVIAVEGIKTGDGRRFAPNSIVRAPLPQAMGWQKSSAPGHDGTVTTMRIDDMKRVGNEIRSHGIILPTKEADDMVATIAHFPRFGVSIDADFAELALEADDAEEVTTFSRVRQRSASVLPIPAFSKAWVSLGDHPSDWYDGGTDIEEYDDELVPTEGEALVAAIERFDRGPGWITNPVATKRIHDYWTKKGQEGYAKIGWGRPGGGDFNTCRVEVGQEIAENSPEDLVFLNQICAQWHHDALGYWPGQEAGALDAMVAAAGTYEGTPLEFKDATPLNLVKSSATKAPAEWFDDPKFAAGDGRMIKDDSGTWGCPLTITEEGEVYGHVAKWRTCHTGYPDTCVTPPFSNNGYAYFHLGGVLTTEGILPCGSLTIGAGHADTRLGLRAAIEHYDNTCAVFANVAAGEDQFGIWVHGWVPPGTPEELVIQARASKLSGDWRKLNGDYQMIAALSVNVPGFVVPRLGVTAGVQNSLVAAGVVEGAAAEEPRMSEDFAADLALRVADIVEQRQAERAERTNQQAALAARFD